MSDYTETLETQNMELRDRLSKAEEEIDAFVGLLFPSWCPTYHTSDNSGLTTQCNYRFVQGTKDGMMQEIVVATIFSSSLIEDTVSWGCTFGNKKLDVTFDNEKAVKSFIEQHYRNHLVENWHVMKENQHG